jgi:hypothetical protein
MSTHGPVDPQLVAAMNELAHLIDGTFNGEAKGEERKWGFCLLAFPFGDSIDGRMNYISNTDRADIIVALKELLARFEGRHPEEGGAKPGPQ